jgi:PAS domain S-box-containing protein
MVGLEARVDSPRGGMPSLTRAATGVARWLGLTAAPPEWLPPDMMVEWRLVAARWLGVLVVLAALPVLSVSASTRLEMCAVLGAAALYNLVVRSLLRRRPELLRRGYATTAADSVLTIAALLLLGGFDSPYYPLLISVTVGAAVRHGGRVALVAALLYIGTDVAVALLFDPPLDGELVLRSGFLALPAFLAGYLRHEARAAAERARSSEHLAAAALRESEQRYRAVVEQSADPIVIVQGTTCVFVSHAFLELVGVPDASRVVGEAIERFIHADDRGLVRDRELRRQGGGLAPPVYEFRIVRADGTPVPIETSTTVISHDGAPAVLAILRDLRSRKEAERQRDALERAEKLRALGQMASGVAHDLNQSLGLVAGYSELARLALSDDPPDLARARDMLGVVGQAAMDGGETVRDLLVFARPTLEGPTAPVRLDLLLWDVMRLTAPRWRDAAQAEGRPIRIDVDAAEDAVVDGQATALRQAVTNLVLNAVDAMSDGGTIRLAAHRRGDVVELVVSDTGAGMPPDVQARVFEPFFTTKEERGTGLGLAQVHGIATAHGGAVAVESSVGRGTTFRLTFPAAAPAEAPTRGEVGEGRDAARGQRVLIVDDEPRLGQMASLMLEADRHDVVTATSAEEALARLAEGDFDVLVSDLGLGAGMNGWELCAQARERWPGLRIVLATGWGAGIDPEAAAERGVSAVLAKPYRASDLRQALIAS